MIVNSLYEIVDWNQKVIFYFDYCEAITNRDMNWLRLVSFIAFAFWESLCYHGLSFWTIRRHPNGQLKVLFSKHAVVISFSLFVLIIYCTSITITEEIKAYMTDDLLQIDQISNILGSSVVFIIIPVIFVSVWVHQHKLKVVGEKIIRISEILEEIRGNFEYEVQKEICKRIAPVILAYLGLFVVMSYMFRTATGLYAMLDGLWSYAIYLVSQLSPTYFLCMSIVKLTITLCVTATRFSGVAHILEMF